MSMSRTLFFVLCFSLSLILQIFVVVVVSRRDISIDQSFVFYVYSPIYLILEAFLSKNSSEEPELLAWILSIPIGILAYSLLVGLVTTFIKFRFFGERFTKDTFNQET